jgi:hypothetical protein
MPDRSGFAGTGGGRLEPIERLVGRSIGYDAIARGYFGLENVLR